MVPTQGFEKITTNYEILIEIFEKLQYEDQMRLAQVNRILRQVYKSYILPKQYRCLKIFSTFLGGFLISNETDRNRKLLRQKEMQKFISLYGKYVRELSVDKPMNFRPFINVVSLSCDGLHFNMKILEQVATQLPHLERFQVLSLRCGKRHFEQAHLENILKMKNLRELQLDFYNDNSDNTIKYQYFRKLLSMPKMEILKLSFEVAADSEEDPISSLNSLKELSIQISLQREKWLQNYPSVLEICRNLKSLTLRLPYRNIMDENTLHLIAKSCPNLESLNLCCICFSNIEIFVIPQSLKELQIYLCYGLAYRNLQQILTQYPKLKKFYSKCSDYMGIFENVPISQALETLELDRVELNDFTMAYDHNENLKNLTWHSHWMWGDKQSLIKAIPMATCKNLETLHMVNCHMSVAILEELKLLRTLKIFLNLPKDWPEIIGLLKHPSLEEVDIEFEESTIKQAPICDNLQTKISHLTLHYPDNYGEDLDFWLDLLQQNKKMKLSLYSLKTHYCNIRDVIHHSKFPRFLKVLYIHGIKIDCNELKNNYEKILSSLKTIKHSHSESEDLDVLEEYDMVLWKI
ncbi:uncharacterized protein LOC142234952 [Haematobia irritans]|uniref:uncharacterized protein LOC142234952 n=1 Tax=Haematobia irritans TaxID=7368 RepID=UPI003F5081BB